MQEPVNTTAVAEVLPTKTKVKRLRRSLPSLPTQASAAEMTTVNYIGKVDATPTNWDALPIHAVFSLSADGNYPMVKVHKSKYADLRTGNSHSCGSGRCYRVIL